MSDPLLDWTYLRDHNGQHCGKTASESAGLCLYLEEHCLSLQRCQLEKILSIQIHISMCQCAIIIIVKIVSDYYTELMSRCPDGKMEPEVMMISIISTFFVFPLEGVQEDLPTCLPWETRGQAGVVDHKSCKCGEDGWKNTWATKSLSLSLASAFNTSKND